MASRLRHSRRYAAEIGDDARVTAVDSDHAAGLLRCGNRSVRPNQLRQSARQLMPFENSSVAIFGTQTQSIGNLFNGNEASARLDYNWNASNRIFAQFNWFHSTDHLVLATRLALVASTNPSQELLPQRAVQLCAHLLRHRSSMNSASAIRRITLGIHDVQSPRRAFHLFRRRHRRLWLLQRLSAVLQGARLQLRRHGLHQPWKAQHQDRRRHQAQHRKQRVQRCPAVVRDVRPDLFRRRCPGG